MLVPIVDLKYFEKCGFKKCKKPYDSCYYLCVARGVKMILVTQYGVYVNDWKKEDPRIHKNANCKYRDKRETLDIIAYLIKSGMIDSTVSSLHNNTFDLSSGDKKIKDLVREANQLTEKSDALEEEALVHLNNGNELEWEETYTKSLEYSAFGGGIIHALETLGLIDNK